ncbi:cell division protein ZapD [Salinimonas sediminis]|uniref:Cell division protein ZapD n=1 Tax=Salinimonas sediminis TaxID=2303538 RepID=A0A346NPM3_9ALTE|nr:cell division protein ZapD [Salinimonas sediminis]AXR07480.1 cell division protein ZapD [Salinimonas sediminis]
MSDTVYEFPLKEKVRNYLRIEQLIAQLKSGASAPSAQLQMYFFDQLFTLLDLFERIDIRTDIVKDLDAHEKNLVYWSQHPNIDSSALENTLRSIVNLRDKLKSCKKFGTELKEDKFLSAIRQRFAIPGGACSFDLPNLHYWLGQPGESRQDTMKSWMLTLVNVEEAIAICLSFLRERGQFRALNATNGFYQGVAEDKNELIRVRCTVDEGYYPNLSGNKYRYALRFMWFTPEPGKSSSVDDDISFSLAAC